MVYTPLFGGVYSVNLKKRYTRIQNTTPHIHLHIRPTLIGGSRGEEETFIVCPCVCLFPSVTRFSKEWMDGFH